MVGLKVELRAARPKVLLSIGMALPLAGLWQMASIEFRQFLYLLLGCLSLLWPRYVE